MTQLTLQDQSGWMVRVSWNLEMSWALKSDRPPPAATNSASSTSALRGPQPLERRPPIGCTA